MSKNGEIIIDIYKKAKKQRIVLNQTEFAKALGYSRVHLFDKMIKHEKGLTDDLVREAIQVLNTKDVSRETMLKEGFLDYSKYTGPESEIEFLRKRLKDLENHIKDLQEDNSVFRKLLEKEDTPPMNSINKAG